MDKKTLHIVTLEIPYPPNKGSTIDMYYRIKALAEAGVEIILHCFYKSFVVETALAPYCKVVYLYARKPLWKIHSLSIPLFVQSRRNDQLIDMLSQDDHPILYEGLHTTFTLTDQRLRHKKKYIRQHNMEAAYYHHLRSQETNPLKKIYYAIETYLVKKYEPAVLFNADHLFSISELENQTYKTLGYNVTWLPPFLDHTLTSKAGRGSYALYHGDLSIKENEAAALFLIEKVFKQLDYPLVVAGKKPSSKIKSLIFKNKKFTLHDTPSTGMMQELIRDAHIILAPFSQTTGYKIKLLESLTKGRHIITTSNVRVYQELSLCLHFACDEDTDWIDQIQTLVGREFTEEEKDIRLKVMDHWFNPKVNIEEFIAKIFG